MGTAWLPWWGWVMLGMVLYPVWVFWVSRLIGKFLWWRGDKKRKWRS